MATIKIMNNSRLVVVESIYYQGADEQPISIDNRYSFSVPNEQPYTRKKSIKGSEGYAKVDNGWIGGRAFVLLVNEGENELAISFDGVVDHLLLLQKRSVRVEVKDVNSLWIKVVKGDGKYAVTLFQE